jgi:hypothetical protein
MRGIVSRLFHVETELLRLNLYDAQQRRFLLRER